MNSRIDHIVIGTDNLSSGTSILETRLNNKFSPGGEHKMMGTHNNLLKLQSDIYLEVISKNPNAETPSCPTWFSLDELSTKEKVKKSPRSLCWIIAVDDIENAVNNCGYYPGEILDLSRGDLKWKISVPSDGRLIENGVLPFFIEWEKNIHPSIKLNKNFVSLKKISLYHENPNKIKNIISNLINLDLIEISEGLPKVNFNLITKHGESVLL